MPALPSRSLLLCPQRQPSQSKVQIADSNVEAIIATNIIPTSPHNHHGLFEAKALSIDSLVILRAFRGWLRIDFGGRQSDRHGLFLKVFELCDEEPNSRL